MLLHDGAADPQTQARSDIFLRCEEGFEDSVLIIAADSPSIVRNQHSHTLAGACESDVDSPVLWNSIDCIQNDIRQYLANFATVALDPYSFRVFFDHTDLFGLNLSPEDPDYFLRSLGQVHLDRRSGIPVERQCPLRYVAYALQFFVGGGEVLPKLS